MKKLLRQFPKAVLLLLVMLAFVQTNAQKRLAPLAGTDFTFTIQHDVQTAPNVLEFDLYLLDTDPAQAFEASIIQVGILINKSCLGTGTPTITLAASPPSQMSVGMIPANGVYASINTTQGILKIAGKSLPGCGNGTVLSTTSPGTLFGHWKITNSVAFPSMSQASLTFDFSGTVPHYKTSVYQYISCVSTAMTTSSTNCYNLNYTNVYLNPIAPTAYAMTGGGSYCEPGAGMPVGLANSQLYVNYSLYQGPTLLQTYPGTGAAIPMGTRPGTFIYSVVGVGDGIHYIGTTNMSNTVTVTLNLMTPITFGPLSPVCAGSALITLGATPAGGTYSQLPALPSYLVPPDQFNPTTAGTFGITYNYTNSLGCPSTPVTQSLTVNPVPVITFGPLADVCEGSSPVILAATPAGGIYSGNIYLSGNTFNPTAAGTYSITYNVSNSFGCAAVPVTQTITVNPTPVITFGPLADACEGSPLIILGATPTGGVYSGNIYLAGNTFNPSTAGTYSIMYSYSNSFGCVAAPVTQTITVNAKPVITFGPLADVCAGSGMVTLTATPGGGTYSGNSYLVGSTFNPSTVGTYPITYNFSDLGCAADPVTQNITVKVCTPTWTGLAMDNEWTTIGNWLGDNVPSASSDAIIPDGCPSYPIITTGEVVQIFNLTVGSSVKSVLTAHTSLSGDLDVDGNMTITASGSFDIGADGRLTITGNLTIVGTLHIESQGSMITNGNVTGNATIDRFIPNDLSWHFLSSPVSQQPICNGEFAPWYPILHTGGYPLLFPGDVNTWDFYNWLPGPCNLDLHWRNLRTTPTGPPNNVDFPSLYFDDSRGYLVAYGPEWTTTKSFYGPPNTADRNLSFYDVSGPPCWALPGNPYPSAIDWSQVLLKENLWEDAYYIWDDVTHSYQWWEGATNWGSISQIDGKIPAEQAFFIRVKLPSYGGGLHIQIPNSARVHDNRPDNWIKSEITNRLSLKIENGTSYNDFAYITFADNCVVARDYKDIEKLFSMDAAVPQIYTIIDNDLKSCSNFLPYINNGTTVPVGFVAPVDGNYSITVGNISSFSSSLKGLSLEDLKLNINQDLLQNPVYNFTATGNEDAGRFLLHFAGAIGINDEKGNSAINIYSNEKTVFITCAAGFQNAQVTICNLLGQEIVSQNLSDQRMNQIQVNALKGYYIVKVQNASSVKTAKVFIN
jgi:hypothetical protein